MLKIYTSVCMYSNLDKFAKTLFNSETLLEADREDPHLECMGKLPLYLNFGTQV